MNTRELSPCFVTKNVDACRDFYQCHFSAKAIFDCGWYLNLRLAGDGPSIAGTTRFVRARALQAQ